MLDCPEAWGAAARWDRAPQQVRGEASRCHCRGPAGLTVCLWPFQTSQAQALPGAAEAAGAPGPRQHPPHHAEPPEARQDAHQGEQGCPSAAALPAVWLAPSSPVHLGACPRPEGGGGCPAGARWRPGGSQGGGGQHQGLPRGEDVMGTRWVLLGGGGEGDRWPFGVLGCEGGARRAGCL